MPSFKTQGQILLQPYDKMSYNFEITTSSSSTANDGFIPYGTTVSSVNAIVYDKDDTVVTSDIIDGSIGISNNIISITLKYPTINGPGRYKITFQMTLSDGSTKEADFDRIVCRND